MDACLLVVELGQSGVTQDAETFAGLDRRHPRGRFGLRGKDLVANVDDYDRLRRFEGLCPFQWRSGLKHDCTAVMELTPVAPDTFLNGSSERVQLEREVVFPFLKATDLARGNIARPRRAVLVTQTHTGEDPARLAAHAPLAWAYLRQRRAALAARKSSIYRNRPEFSIFGVGAYAFAPFKVAVSGLHSEPAFAMVSPVGRQPVFFDDTCYYLSFESESQARVVHEILNSEPARRFLSALVFPDSKRPITVELLQRLDLAALAEEVGLGETWRAIRAPQLVPVKPGEQFEMVMETL